MSNRTLNSLVVLLLVGILALFTVNLLPMLYPHSKEKFIGFNDVKGIAVEHNQNLWELNFDQQNQLIDSINHAIQVKKEGSLSKQDFPFQSIVIYRFNGDDVVLKPLGKNGNHLVFSAPQLLAETYLQDMTTGEMQNLIQSTYDH